MVFRSTDEPRHPIDRLHAQRRHTEEVARAQARGSTALRDEGGNAVTMNGAAPYPLLRPQGVDVSVAFDPTTNAVKMVSPDTSADRDLTVRNLTYSGTSAAASDQRLKHRLRPVADADIDAVLDAPVQWWQWRPRPYMDADGHRFDEVPDAREHATPVAQDLPESLQVLLEGGVLGVDWTSVNGLLLAAVQRQKAQIGELQARLERAGL